MRDIRPPKAAVDAPAKGTRTGEQLDNTGHSDINVGPIQENVPEGRVVLEAGMTPKSSEKRTAVSDRRMTDRRRSARGLFEILARREQVDRRQLERRGTRKFKLAFWRS